MRTKPDHNTAVLDKKGMFCILKFYQTRVCSDMRSDWGLLPGRSPRQM
jgi:hypothetical protein